MEAIKTAPLKPEISPHMKTNKSLVPILCITMCAPLISLAQAQTGTKDEEVQKMLKIGVPEETKQENREVSDEKKLPRVLLIGDSISGGYLGGVSSRLKGAATVVRGNNAGDSRGGLEQIDKILGTERWDVIHFNWGLHDMTWQFRMKPEDRGIEQYAARLEKIVLRLEKTGAKLIWATTTPWCPEDYEYIEKRFKQKYDYAGEEELKWKKAALEVMSRHNVDINDLYSLLYPKLDEFLNKPTDIHFNGKGSASMAEQISKVVGQHLKEDAASNPRVGEK